MSHSTIKAGSLVTGLTSGKARLGRLFSRTDSGQFVIHDFFGRPVAVDEVEAFHFAVGDKIWIGSSDAYYCLRYQGEQADGRAMLGKPGEPYKITAQPSEVLHHIEALALLTRCEGKSHIEKLAFAARRRELEASGYAA